MMNKVSELEKLRSEAKENTKAIIERKEALEKGLQEIKKKLEDKNSKLEAFVAVDNEKKQAAYYQGQTNYIASVKPEVQQILQVYFAKGLLLWTRCK